MSVCLCDCVCVVDHALTVVLIDFIFGMYIDLIPGSDIGPIKLTFKIIKDHLWTKYFLCDVPYVQKSRNLPIFEHKVHHRESILSINDL